MLRLLIRIPAKRLMHTSATRPAASAFRGRAGLVLGASAVTAYVAWRASTQPAIAMDSASSAHTSSSTPRPKAADPVATKEDSSLSEPSVAEAAPAEVLKKAEEAAEVNEAAETEGHPEEQGGGGAFNPVTGEINWDCPCLGGMAHGPCGMQFREAFSCFIFSEQEPKGIDCVEKFKAMQDCFREHPDVYADEIMDDDDDDDESAATREPRTTPQDATSEEDASQTKSQRPPAASSPSEDASTP